ncbi:trypco2 family protein [Kitasatospora sp. NPDC047058]|uniref:trypco2 family protein n=1 Tax=Kitasatospora sp. NPDC047058 TaxID=3155620 RepID=UPI0033DD80B3
MPNEPWAELGETVSAIRTQLQQAMEEGDNRSLRFRSGPLELEFSVAVRKEGEAKARIFVLPWASAEARGAVGSDAFQRIKLTLEPIDKTGTSARISKRVHRRPA